jgi:ankyrin repeat protein
MSAFWYFYTNNRNQEAMYLVDKGANINHIDNYGMFALKRELFQANYENIKILLEKGANPN